MNLLSRFAARFRRHRDVAPLGPVRLIPAGTRPWQEPFFGPVLPDTRTDRVEPLPNPLDRLDPKVRAGIEAMLVPRRPPTPWNELYR